ncbi:MAG TPA: LytTR family DNA-binding domain-containing protein [Gammaproteobacteria bacterium]|nr:LytTR family DNA-binding domain-containing protein [Gammaproteobacteria bacterium]
MSVDRLRVLLVDDERLARRALRTLLAAERDIEVVGEASRVDEAARLIRRERPAVVFLDVQLRGETGFDLLACDAGPFQTIFVTAFDAYAVRAFEVHALDYLLKPVHPARLAEALARAREPATPRAVPERPTTYRYDDLFFHDDSRRPRFVRIREIAFIRAAGNYTELYTAAGPPLLVLRPLSTWEAQLVDTPFVRVHRSALVNLDFVERIERGTSYTYGLYVRGHAAPLAMSRRRALELKSRRDALGNAPTLPISD